MRAKATATTIAVLLLTACSQSVPVEDKRLTGIVNLKCYAPVVLGHTKGLIIDTESWKLLHYEIESDTLKELTVSPGFKKGVEKRWTIEKQGTTLAVTSREAFSEIWKANFSSSQAMRPSRKPYRQSEILSLRTRIKSMQKLLKILLA